MVAANTKGKQGKSMEKNLVSRISALGAALGLLAFGLFAACKGSNSPEPVKPHIILGASVTAPITYQYGNFPTTNLASGAVAQVPQGATLNIGLQSTTNLYKVTYSMDCPDYYVNGPQTFSILPADGANSTTVAFLMPIAPMHCQLITNVTDGYQYDAFAANTFWVSNQGIIEIPITGVVSTDAASLAVVSNTSIVVGSVIDRVYLAPSTAFDAGCNIQLGAPIDGGTASIFGYFDASAGSTLTAANTVVSYPTRVFVDASTVIQASLGAQCEAGIGVVGVEYTVPQN